MVLTDNLAWDPDYMGSSMMVPVVYVTWFMAVVFTSLMRKSPRLTCMAHHVDGASHQLRGLRRLLVSPYFFCMLPVCTAATGFG